MINQNYKKRNIWSVISRNDNYIAQVTTENGRAKSEGWRVVESELTVSEACELRDNLKASINHNHGIAADLSDLLMWDYAITEDDAVDTFDTIYVECRDGIYRTGVVMRWNTRTVYIEVGTITYAAKKSTAQLVCKIEETHENDNELDIEYDIWAETLDTEISQTGELAA